MTLPKRQFDLHYRAAWVGFDVLLVFAIARTAYMAFRVDQRVQFPATATATLLIVDAWFDVTTSGGRGQFFEALLLAVCIEIPAAAVLDLRGPTGQSPAASSWPVWPSPASAAPAGRRGDRRRRDPPAGRRRRRRARVGSRLRRWRRRCGPARRR